MTKTKGRTGKAKTPELVTLVVALALLGGLLGTLLYQQLSRGKAPAAFTADPDYSAAFEKAGEWYLPVSIANVGDESTDTLRVDVVQRVDGAEPEVSELEFTFVAGGEDVSGWAVFGEEPTPENVSVDVISITDP